MAQTHFGHRTHGYGSPCTVKDPIHLQFLPGNSTAPHLSLFNTCVQSVVPKPLDWGDATVVSG